MATSPIPKGYHTITAQLSLDDAAQAIEFYRKAFGAEVIDKAPDPSGKKIWHAALRIGDSMLFVNDIFPEMGGSASHTGLWLYVNDVDASYKRADDAPRRHVLGRPHGARRRPLRAEVGYRDAREGHDARRAEEGRRSLHREH